MNDGTCQGPFGGGGHMTNFLKWSKTKVVALQHSFQNLFKFCSEVLLLWRCEVEDFSQHCFFVFFCFFLHENNTKYHDFNTFTKLREGATTFVVWENSPKKESAFPKREIDTDRLQKITGGQ
jgi:hypothetical protein